MPRVNPDGAEWALADPPQFRRSSTRPWPWSDAHRWPGAHTEDVDGDGRVLQMRIADRDGAWMRAPRRRAAARAGAAGRRTRPAPLATACSTRARSRTTTASPCRRRARRKGSTSTATSRPAGATQVLGAGDHPLSEPEIDALVRAIVARPNVCGYNAFHTSGGVLLRPSSTQPDSTLPPVDVWTWKQLGEIGTRLTGYPVHSVFEDFTFDKAVTMSGAADDWAYEHLGVFSWTTEFWDVVEAATGTKQGDRRLVRRADRRAGARRAALGRRARPRRVRAVVPVRAPAARAGRAGRLAVPRDLDQPAGVEAEGGGGAPRRVRRRPGDGRRRAWRSCTPAPSISAAAHGASRPAWPTPAGCRPTSRRARPRPISCVRSSPSSPATASRSSAVRRGCSWASSPGVRRCASATGATARRTGCWRAGSSRPAPATTVTVTARHDRAGATSAEIAPPRQYLTFQINFSENGGYARRRARCTHRHRPVGGRSDHRAPRGGRRVRATGAAVLRRQGLRRPAAPGTAGVLAGARSRSR